MFVVYKFWTGDAAILLVTKSHKKARKVFLKEIDEYFEDSIRPDISEEKPIRVAPFQGTLWEATTNEETLRLDQVIS